MALSSGLPDSRVGCVRSWSGSLSCAVGAWVVVAVVAVSSSTVRTTTVVLRPTTATTMTASSERSCRYWERRTTAGVLRGD